METHAKRWIVQMIMDLSFYFSSDIFSSSCYSSAVSYTYLKHTSARTHKLTYTRMYMHCQKNARTDNQSMCVMLCCLQHRKSFGFRFSQLVDARALKSRPILNQSFRFHSIHRHSYSVHRFSIKAKMKCRTKKVSFTLFVLSQAMFFCCCCFSWFD